MTLTKIEFNSKGFRELLMSPEMGADIARRTEAVRKAAGDGFQSRVFVGSYGGSRWVGVVYTDTVEAMVRESQDNVLENALDAGR